MRAFLDSRLFSWTLLALPGAAMLAGYFGGRAEAADMLDPTGEMSARLLIAALMVTPLMVLTRGAHWVRWLQARRRYIGVAAFLYALAHLIFYVIDMETIDDILAEALALGIWTGWLALFAMLPLAATSNDRAMRAMKAGWKRLQRLAYPAALLTLAHWLFIHDGAVSAFVHFAPLALLEIYRIFHTLRKVRHYA